MKKNSMVAKGSQTSKKASKEPQELPPYLGLGVLDAGSVSTKAGKTTAAYMLGDEVVYRVMMSEKCSEVTEYFDREELGRSREATLRNAFLQYMMSFPPYENPRFERLYRQITEDRNIYLQFASEPQAIYFPAGYIFSLKQPIVSSNRAKWNALKKKLAREKDDGVVQLEGEKKSVILRLLDSGKVTVEDVDIGECSAILLNLAAATDLFWQSGVVPDEKEYRLIATDCYANLPGNMRFYLGEPARGFVTFSILGIDDIDAFDGMDNVIDLFADQSRQFLIK